ncbi:DNA repair protein XRCC3 [Patella vulgata]|uniref:DNA repair protein XRCC3 n=1 Tax=Patella vulgata TaxID=6465 RepID=UPI0024A8AC36|nr:DNA repair protein XRCC3 [Patella vulgata]
MSKFDDLDINPRILTAIKRSKLTSVESVLSLSGPDLERTCQLSSSDVSTLKHAIAESIPKPDPCTALDLWKGECVNNLKIKKLSIGCDVFDNFLRGGIISRGITELSGESASGKTQFCLQLCLTVQLPVTHGGLAGGAVYICTEDAFPNKRLQQLISHYNEKYSGLKERIQFSDNIYIEHISDYDGLTYCIHKKLPVLLAQGLIQLVIVDSVAALFRCDYENHEMIKRAKHMNTFAGKLRGFSQQYNIPIVCVNQVSDCFDKSSTRKVLPALGLTWSNQVTSRFMLAKTSCPIQLENSIPNKSVDGSVRKFEVVFAPNIPQLVFPFIVDKYGIHGLK